MKRALARYLPLLGHVVPTLVIGYGLVIPRSCIAGWNELSLPASRRSRPDSWGG
jgi:ABC-type Fe3+ transport system permease subunit